MIQGSESDNTLRMTTGLPICCLTSIQAAWRETWHLGGEVLKKSDPLRLPSVELDRSCKSRRRQTGMCLKWRVKCETSDSCRFMTMTNLYIIGANRILHQSSGGMKESLSYCVPNSHQWQTVGVGKTFVLWGITDHSCL